MLNYRIFWNFATCKKRILSHFALKKKNVRQCSRKFENKKIFSFSTLKGGREGVTRHLELSVQTQAYPPTSNSSDLGLLASNSSDLGPPPQQQFRPRPNPPATVQAQAYLLSYSSGLGLFLGNNSDYQQFKYKFPAPLLTLLQVQAFKFQCCMYLYEQLLIQINVFKLLHQ